MLLKGAPGNFVMYLRCPHSRPKRTPMRIPIFAKKVLFFQWEVPIHEIKKKKFQWSYTPSIFDILCNHGNCDKLNCKSLCRHHNFKCKSYSDIFSCSKPNSKCMALFSIPFLIVLLFRCIADNDPRDSRVTMESTVCYKPHVLWFCGLH